MALGEGVERPALSEEKDEGGGGGTI